MKIKINLISPGLVNSVNFFSDILSGLNFIFRGEFRFADGNYHFQMGIIIFRSELSLLYALLLKRVCSFLSQSRRFRRCIRKSTSGVYFRIRIRIKLYSTTAAWLISFHFPCKQDITYHLIHTSRIHVYVYCPFHWTKRRRLIRISWYEITTKYGNERRKKI